MLSDDRRMRCRRRQQGSTQHRRVVNLYRVSYSSGSLFFRWRSLDAPSLYESCQLAVQLLSAKTRSAESRGATARSKSAPYCTSSASFCVLVLQLFSSTDQNGALCARDAGTQTPPSDRWAPELAAVGSPEDRTRRAPRRLSSRVLYFAPRVRCSLLWCRHSCRRSADAAAPARLRGASAHPRRRRRRWRRCIAPTRELIRHPSCIESVKTTY